MTTKQRMIILSKNKKKWLALNSKLNENSGIYILTRYENGLKYAYVGQAKHILTRLAEHLMGWQHIDLSLKTHGLFSNNNSIGWQVSFLECPESELDRLEQDYIKKYANLGFQMRNKTGGSQGQGKVQINDYKANKGYYDGIRQGYNKSRKEIKKLFDKYLNVSVKKDNKISQRMLQKFYDFLGEDDEKQSLHGSEC